MGRQYLVVSESLESELCFLDELAEHLRNRGRELERFSGCGLLVNILRASVVDGYEPIGLSSYKFPEQRDALPTEYFSAVIHLSTSRLGLSESGIPTIHAADRDVESVFNDLRWLEQAFGEAIPPASPFARIMSWLRSLLGRVLGH